MDSWFHSSNCAAVDAERSGSTELGFRPNSPLLQFPRSRALRRTKVDSNALTKRYGSPLAKVGVVSSNLIARSSFIK